MAWIPGDQNLETGPGFLLLEDGCFLLQENYCRVIINENDAASWEPGDAPGEYTDPITPDGCPVPVENTNAWIPGD